MIADKYIIESIKYKIKELFETNPNIHVNIILAHPKLNLKNVEVKIVGVYSHIFQIEEYTKKTPQRHTLLYSDVAINNVEILEFKNANL